MAKLILPLALVAYALVSLASTSRAEACSCMRPGEPIEEAKRHEAVVLGSVNGTIDVDGMQVTVPFTVEEWFKGEGEKSIVVQTTSQSAACGFSMKEGERYLLYLGKNDAGYTVSLCSRSRVADETSFRELEVLRSYHQEQSTGGESGDETGEKGPSNKEDLDPRGEPVENEPAALPPPQPEPPAQRRGCGGCSQGASEGLPFHLALILAALFISHRRRSARVVNTSN